jgi:3-isopropylmalate dehydrogenase
LRAELGLFVNLRPIRPHRRLRGASPLRPELLDGVDLVFVRELTGGLYFGPRGRRDGSAFDTCVYSEQEVVRFAARLAAGRRGKLTSIDKANVLETSRLWRAAAERVVGEEFQDLHLDHRYVDAAAMQLISDPAGFDVIVTENLFGDILSDEGAVLCGSLGMLPSASLGEGSRGLYEPVHGSAPDIAGKGIANPYAAILCVALLLRHSLADEAAAQAVERAVDDAIDDGFVTADLAAGMVPIGTEVAADAVLERLGELI